MLSRKIFPIALAAAATLALAATADARSIRVDSGDWDVCTDTNTCGLTDVALGFNFDFFGFNATNATISDSGGLTLSDGAESANVFGFFDPSQTAGGNSVSYEYATTNDDFTTAGVESGFRVTYNTRDAAGALLNQFQISLFELTGGTTALEFNYNQLLFGSDSSQVGYSSSLGELLDLLGVLDLDFSEYSGIGNDPDDPNIDNCSATPSALACNNYYAGVFEPGADILPGIANGFFQVIDTNGGAAQGRYVFVSESVPEPSPLALLGLGLLGLAIFHRRIRLDARRSNHAVVVSKSSSRR